MKYQRGLQVKLQERYRRLYKSDDNAYLTEIKYFHDFLTSSPVLKSILATLVEASKEFDGDAWFAANFGHKSYAWPRSENDKLKLIWELIQQWAAFEATTEAEKYGVRGPLRMAMTHFSSNNGKMDGCLRTMTEDAIEPLVEYLQRCLIDDNDMLYLLERYKRMVEWFEAESLHATFLSDTKRGEKVYDTNLRRFLFAEGIDNPFSQAASPSGRADVLAGLESDDSLVCEVKLFDAKDYGVRYIAKGLGQAVRYAKDWHKTVSYLVVFNVSDVALELPTDDSSAEWPPRLQVEGITVYIVMIQAKPLDAASISGRPRPRRVGREELVSEVMEA